MKCTSFEISKKLAEIGFTGGGDTIYWYDPKGVLNYDQAGIYLTSKQQDEAILAFDLETILRILPSNLSIKRPKKIDNILLKGHYYLAWEPNSFYYGNGILDDSFYCHNLVVETMADTAARLLIKLAEQKIIQF